MSEYAHPEEEKKEMALLKIGELASLAGVSSKLYAIPRKRSLPEEV